MCLVKVYVVENGQLAHYMDSEDNVRHRVLCALNWLHKNMQASGWRNLRSPEELLQHCMDEFMFLHVENSYVAVSTVEPWFVDEIVLAEEFNAPYEGETGADVEEISAALGVMAKAAGCTMYSLGTRANLKQRGLARLFEKTGARISTIELVKELP
ncbi:hypothetical protein D3C76_922470 [compost metagenome]